MRFLRNHGVRVQRGAGPFVFPFAFVFALLFIFLGAGSGVARGAQLLEPPRARQGYYIAVGQHLALNYNWEDGESWGLWPGRDLSIRFGQLLTRRFGLGLQINSGATSGNAQKAAFGGLELEAQWEVARNFALHGGVGIDVVSLTSTNGTDKTTRGTVGSGYFLQLSYDWFFTHRLTGGWALTPTIEARFVPGSTASAFIGLIGVEIAYWTGLPRNQLDLPPDEAFKAQRP